MLGLCLLQPQLAGSFGFKNILLCRRSLYQRTENHMEECTTAYLPKATGGHIFVDQMYVEQLLPAGNATLKDPVVFHHGQVQTGTVSEHSSRSFMY